MNTLRCFVISATVAWPTLTLAVPFFEGGSPVEPPLIGSLQDRSQNLLKWEVLIAQNSEAGPPQASGDVSAQSGEEDGLLDRAKKAVQEAGRNVSEAATAAGRSAADYLEDNPDLNRQVLDFGQQLGFPGFDSTPAAGAQLVVTRTEDAQLRVVASGLPGKTDVNLGWLDDNTFHTLQALTADASGRIDTTIPTPSNLANDQEVTLAIETSDRRLRLTSDPIKPL